MKAQVGAFNQEKALVGASMIVKPMDRLQHYPAAASRAETPRHGHTAKAGGVPCPGLSDGGPGREVRHRAADHHQEAGRGGGVVLTNPGAEDGGAGGGEDEIRGIARLTGGPNQDLGC